MLSAKTVVYSPLALMRFGESFGDNAVRLNIVPNHAEAGEQTYSYITLLHIDSFD
jgi:hypothetical protein